MRLKETLDKIFFKPFQQKRQTLTLDSDQIVAVMSQPQAGDDAHSFRYRTRTRTSEAHWISLSPWQSFHYSWLHQEFPQNPQLQIEQHNRNNHLLQPKGKKKLNAPNDPKNFKTWSSLCLNPEEILLLLLLQETNRKLISATKLGSRESFKCRPSYLPNNKAIWKVMPCFIPCFTPYPLQKSCPVFTPCLIPIHWKSIPRFIPCLNTPLIHCKFMPCFIPHPL